MFQKQVADLQVSESDVQQVWHAPKLEVASVEFQTKSDTNVVKIDAGDFS